MVAVPLSAAFYFGLWLRAKGADEARRLMIELTERLDDIIAVGGFTTSQFTEADRRRETAVQQLAKQVNDRRLRSLLERVDECWRTVWGHAPPSYPIVIIGDVSSLNTPEAQEYQRHRYSEVEAARACRVEAQATIARANRLERLLVKR